ncbi:hypothetical protein RI367_003547 [Sorochytrium milnesiophthora]
MKAATTLLLSLCVLLGTVYADEIQKGTSPSGVEFNCSDLDPKTDVTCSIMPYRTSMVPGQTEKNIRTATGGLKAFGCNLPDTLGLMVCMSSYGSCADPNSTWRLPKGDSDVQGAVEMYDSIHFGDLMPYARTHNLTEKTMCYEECSAAFSALRNCSFFTAINRTDDACAGLPQRSKGDKCIGEDEYHAALAANQAAATAQPTPAATQPAATKGNNAAATMQGMTSAAAVAIVGAMVSLAL